MRLLRSDRDDLLILWHVIHKNPTLSVRSVFLYSGSEWSALVIWDWAEHTSENNNIVNNNNNNNANINNNIISRMYLSAYVQGYMCWWHVFAVVCALLYGTYVCKLLFLTIVVWTFDLFFSPHADNKQTKIQSNYCVLLLYIQRLLLLFESVCVTYLWNKRRKGIENDARCIHNVQVHIISVPVFIIVVVICIAIVVSAPSRYTDKLWQIAK